MEEELIIDAENQPLGRLAAFVAKQALLGKKIKIANCEKIVISGNREAVLEEYRRRRARGSAEKGPFFPKTPERIVKRAIRGMLPYKKPKGKAALERISVFKGPLRGMKNINLKKSPLHKYMTIEELSKLL